MVVGSVQRSGQIWHVFWVQNPYLDVLSQSTIVPARCLLAHGGLNHFSSNWMSECVPLTKAVSYFF